MSIILDNTVSLCAPYLLAQIPEKRELALPRAMPYLVLRTRPRPFHMKASLLDTAISLHGSHVTRAARALSCDPIRLDLFALHHNICKTILKTLEDEKVLAKQLMDDAESSSENPEQ